MLHTPFMLAGSREFLLPAQWCEGSVLCKLVSFSCSRIAIIGFIANTQRMLAKRQLIRRFTLQGFYPMDAIRIGCGVALACTDRGAIVRANGYSLDNTQAKHFISFLQFACLNPHFHALTVIVGMWIS